MLNVILKLGKTPLFIACQFGHRDVAEFLIDSERMIDVRNNIYSVDVDNPNLTI